MQLSVKNIGGCRYGKFGVELGRVTRIAGPNRSGKTSILRALCVLATRKTDPFKDSAVNSRLLATNGDTSESEARLSGPDWSLTWTPGGAVNEQGSPPGALSDPVVIEPELLKEKGAKARASWSRVLPCDVPHDLLRDRLTQALEGVRKRDDIVRDLCAQVFETVTPEELDEDGSVVTPGVYRERTGGWQNARDDAAARLRAEKNLWEKAVAATGVSLDWSESRAKNWWPVGWDRDCDQMTIPEAERHVDAARRTYNETYAANAVTAAQVELRESLKVDLVSATQPLGTLVALRDTARNQLFEKKQWKALVEQERETKKNAEISEYSELLQAYNAANACVDHRKGMEDGIASKNHELARLKQDLRSAEDRLAELPPVPAYEGTPCPSCGTRLDIIQESAGVQVIRVNKTKQRRDAHDARQKKVNEAKEAIRDTRLQIEALKQQRKAHIARYGEVLQVPPEPKMPPATDNSDLHDVVNPLRDEFNAADSAVAAQKSKVAEIERQLKKLPEGDAGDPDMVRSAEADLDAAKLRLTLVKAWRTARGHYESAARWKLAVNTLQPAGLRSEHSKNVIDEFNRYVESRSPDPESPIGLPFRLDPDSFRVMARGRPLAHASGTEQLVARAVLSVAIAKWTDSQLVVLDEVDAIVEKADRLEFWDMLGDLARDAPVAIVAAIATPTSGGVGWQTAE